MPCAVRLSLALQLSFLARCTTAHSCGMEVALPSLPFVFVACMSDQGRNLLLKLFCRLSCHQNSREVVTRPLYESFTQAAAALFVLASFTTAGHFFHLWKLFAVLVLLGLGKGLALRQLLKLFLVSSAGTPAAPLSCNHRKENSHPQIPHHGLHQSASD